MSGEFDPDAYLAKATSAPAQARPSGEFDPDAYLKRVAPLTAPAPKGSPLERALAEQGGPVVLVETPTGPVQFTRDGQRFYGAGESKEMLDRNEPAFRQKALEGALSFASGGGPLIDEMRGAVSAMGSPHPLDAYRQVRDDTRQEVARATTHASPVVSVGGQNMPVLPMLGAALPQLLTPVPLTAMARILSAGAQGAMSGFGASEADLTRGDVSGAARDTAIGGGAGLATSAVAEGVTAPLRALSRATARESSAAKDAAIAASQAAKDKALRSATSSLGGVAAGGMNSIEKMQLVLANPGEYAPSVVAEAQAMRGLPEVQEALNRAAGGSLEKLRRFIPDYEAAELARAEAAAAAQPAAVVAGVEAKLDPQTLARDIGSKAWKSLGQRAVLGAAGSALGAGVDAVTGGEDRPGAKYGGLAGLLAGPGAVQFMRNQAASPLVQAGANQFMSSLLAGASNGVTRAAPMAVPVVGNRLAKALAEQRERQEREKRMSVAR